MYLVVSSEEISGQRPSQGKVKTGKFMQINTRSFPDISVILSAFLLSGKRVVKVGNQMERSFSLDISFEKKEIPSEVFLFSRFYGIIGI